MGALPHESRSQGPATADVSGRSRPASHTHLTRTAQSICGSAAHRVYRGGSRRSLICSLLGFAVQVTNASRRSCPEQRSWRWQLMRSLTSCISWSPNSETRSCRTFFHHACWLFITPVTPVTHAYTIRTLPSVSLRPPTRPPPPFCLSVFQRSAFCFASSSKVFASPYAIECGFRASCRRFNANPVETTQGDRNSV
eukprot:COSAG06_NODE_741_length_12661_cov_24.506607_13_plen_196_part_00